MKHKVLSATLGSLLLASSFIAQAQPAAPTAQKSVTALEDQWTQAERKNDVASMAPLIADKFIGIDLDGKISSRAEELADAKATKYSSVDIEDLHITVSGHTAVAVMVFKAKLTDAMGKPQDIKARWADTWVKMPNGAWQCVLSQGTGLK